MTTQIATAAKPRRARKPKEAADQVQATGIASSPAAIASTAAERKATRKDQLLGLLHQESGATLAELVTAFDWLPHTARAALTGLRKAGHTIDKGKRDDVTCYRIKAAG